jgi:hypothetical protein
LFLRKKSEISRISVPTPPLQDLVHEERPTTPFPKDRYDVELAAARRI